MGVSERRPRECRNRLEREGPKLRASLGRLCSEHGIAMGDLEDLRGFRLLLRSPRASLARGRALLVGDAEA